MQASEALRIPIICDFLLWCTRWQKPLVGDRRAVVMRLQSFFRRRGREKLFSSLSWLPIPSLLVVFVKAAYQNLDDKEINPWRCQNSASESSSCYPDDSQECDSSIEMLRSFQKTCTVCDPTQNISTT